MGGGEGGFTKNQYIGEDGGYWHPNAHYASASNKAKLIAKRFSRNSNLNDLNISLLVFPSRTNLNCIIFL